MYQIAYIGRWETLPETAAAICDHDTPKLEALLQGGLDLGAPIQLSEYIKLMPLEIAVFQNDVPMIHFLLEHGADPGLAEEQSLLLTAARCCGPEVVSLFAEQAAKLSPKQKERAFQEVRWGQRAENIQVLEQAGITVDKFGGEAFRAAVSEGNIKLARLLLEKGADINYHKPDMVFPYASTPVTEAARSNNFPMVRWLIEQGADITIVDKYGDRPYSVAVQNKNHEMADYLKALEPEEWHNEQEKIRQLMPYKLPAKLVEYLKTGPLRLEFPNQKWVKWAELYSFMDVQEMTWKRKKLLSLMVQMDNYSDYLVVRPWCISKIVKAHEDCPELQAVLDEYHKPVVLQDQVLGELTLDKDYDTFEGEIQWCGKSVSLSLEVNAESKPSWTRARSAAKKLLCDCETWDKAMRELAAKNLTELANSWLSQDEENPRDPETDPITEEELARRISMTSLSVTSGGSFTAWFDCDEMFTDHAVTVYGSLKKGLKTANIEG